MKIILDVIMGASCSSNNVKPMNIHYSGPVSPDKKTTEINNPAPPPHVVAHSSKNDVTHQADDVRTVSRSNSPPGENNPRAITGESSKLVADDEATPGSSKYQDQVPPLQLESDSDSLRSAVPETRPDPVKDPPNEGKDSDSFEFVENDIEVLSASSLTGDWEGTAKEGLGTPEFADASDTNVEDDFMDVNAEDEQESPEVEEAEMLPVDMVEEEQPQDMETYMDNKVQEIQDTIENTYRYSMMLPNHQIPALVSDLRATCSSKWPIRCYGKLNINVNAKYGGGAALGLISCAYGEKGNGSTGQLFLLRFGFDGNHLNHCGISQCHAGHFGPSTSFMCEEDGTLLSDNLFGSNHLSLISNIGMLTSADHAVVVSGRILPIDVNGSACGEHGGGATLILCSCVEAGTGDTTVTYGLYQTRLGFENNHFTVKFFHGEDKWKFDIDEQSHLCVDGPGNSRYSIFHNRPNLLPDCPGVEHARVAHMQAFNGEEGTEFPVIFPSHSCILLLCSHSHGNEDQTSAALYAITVKQDDFNDPEIVTASLIQGLSGPGYSTHDLWTFRVQGRKVVVTGPSGPCRYALLTNISESQSPAKTSQQICLATGLYQQIRGAVSINKNEVLGWVDRRATIRITLEEREVAIFSADQLKDADGQYAFHYAWRDDHKTVGLKLARVFAVEDGKEIELQNSPQQLIYQPQGVVYSSNVASNSYQATNGVTYESEHRRWVNFSKDHIFGTRHRCGGGIKSNAWRPFVLRNTHDNFLYHMCRSKGVEADDEKTVHYTLRDMPSGPLTVRVHFVSEGAGVSIGGIDFSSQINKSFSTQFPKSKGYTARYADIGPVEAVDGNLSIKLGSSMISGFAVLDSTFKEKQKTSEEIEAEKEMKQTLSDKAEPPARTMTKKQMSIVGWSQNLLQNASAEEGNTKHWNTSGNFTTAEGGHGTERKFVTSHMWCTKTQIVELTNHFSAEYLDTGPEIQVSEWYREGCSGGGFYKFTAALLGQDGRTIEDYESGEIGRIYNQNEWNQESMTFSNYGPGVRAVMITSAGKDDKFWAGHYGAMMSDAVVRVKRQTTPADGDVFEDIIGTSETDKSFQKEIDQIIVKVLTDNQGLFEGMVMDQVLPEVDEKFSKQVGILSPRKVKVRRKKREIRVFVSSTFRDFREEREILIKKTFREINALCADRGIFFTYVDLRWGITSEQTDDGKTIAICLQEIDKCRPYFICMMGDRFGWCQKEEKPDSQLDKSFNYAIENHKKTMGWIEDFRFDTSVTQLEIFHGALNHPEAAAGRVFFYQRHPPEKEDASEADFKTKASESDWHHERQYALRDAVNKSGLPVKDYSESPTVCEFIKEDLQNCIEDDFPLGTQLTALEREKESHDAFADARRHVYIGREEYFTTINQQVKTHMGQPFVILGESGCGKSALVANWSGRLEERESNAFIFLHFIGSTSDSASYIKLLRRLFEEMKTFFKFDLAIPSSDADLVRDLPAWLTQAGARRKCIIILDALNQLDEGLGTEGPEHDLKWLPPVLPPGVFMIMSTLPGRAMDSCSAAGWPTMKVEKLDPSQKRQIITDYLESIYGKTLSEDQKDLIVDAPQTNNPLYLKALLDEVRIYGSFSTLTKKIQDYLLADTPGDLFSKILERLEKDFEFGTIVRPGLVKETTVAIWCASRGMSEEELRELLQVQSAVWSPFYLSLAENLVNRNGILNFFHDHLRQAVESKYLPTVEDKRREYKHLAYFFEGRELSNRKLEELPYLLTMAGETERLKETISDVEVFRHLVKTESGKFELIKAWKSLGEFSIAETAYMKSLESYMHKIGHHTVDEKDIELFEQMAQFFSDLGLLKSARSMFEKLASILEVKYLNSHGTVVYHTGNFSRKFRCKHPLLLKTLHRLGNVCEKEKDLTSAFNYYEDSLQRQNRVDTPDQELLVCEALLGLATVLIAQDNSKDGRLVLLRARELATNVLGPRHSYVAAIINKLGQLAYKQGRVEEALGYFIQDLNLTRSEFGTTHPRIAQIINDIALVYDDQNDQLAGKLYELSLRILVNTYGSVHVDVAVIRYNLGAFYFATNYFSRAKFQFKEATSVFESYLGGEHPFTNAAKEALEAMPVQ